MFSARRSQAPGRAVDGQHARAGAGELRRLAAGGGAEIGDALAGTGRDEAGRQRRRGVLHPPRAVAVAGKFADRDPSGRQPHAAGRQNDAAEALGPGVRVSPDREVERRAPAMRLGDGARAGRAEALRPAPREPVGRVVPQRIRAVQDASPLARDPAQDSVRQADERLEALVARREADRGVDRRVVGHIEEEDLGRADREQRGEALVAWPAFGETLKEGAAEGAEAAKQHDGDRPRQRLVARRERGLRGEAGEDIVERGPAAQNFDDDGPGEAARAESGGALPRRSLGSCVHRWPILRTVLDAAACALHLRR